MGGCSVSSQIFVPKSPESYLWVFPSGCFDACEGQQGSIIGPTTPFDSWNWIFDGNANITGQASWVSPINVNHSGTYNQSLNNGFCEATAAPLNYAMLDCDRCRLDIRGIDKIDSANTPFCAYNFNFIMSSYLPMAYQATITEANNLVFVPAAMTILPGTNTYNFTVVPVNNFSGGVVTISIQGTYIDPKSGEAVTCIFTFDVDFPPCAAGRFQETKDSNRILINDENSVSLFPNPTQNTVTLSYNLVEDKALVYVYDITGRVMTTKNIEAKKGELYIDTASYEAGIYIVVLKQNDTIINQQKLLKK